MSKFKDFDFYFIHIPKNAGTSIQTQFCDGHCGHGGIRALPHSCWEKTIAIVRNPYSRLVSCYNYAKLKKSYWHSTDGSTKFGKHDLYDYCTTHSFEEFIIILCTTNKFDKQTHLLPQYSFIEIDNTIIPRLVRYENIDFDLSKILQKNIKLVKMNCTTKIDYESYYTNKLKKLVYNKYKRDFELFNYCE